MQVTNTTGIDLYVPAVGDVVAAGSSVEIDDTAGRSLVEQGWKAAKSTTDKAAPAKTKEN